MEVVMGIFGRGLALILCALALGGCYGLRPSSGGGKASFEPPRQLQPADVALPEEYAIEVVTDGLVFPTGVTFDQAGNIYVVESGYSYGEAWTTPRLLRIEADGRRQTILEGGRNGPWTGVTFHEGYFYVAEGSQLAGGSILRISPQGEMTIIARALPSLGDHHTNGPVAGPDGWLYFGQGTATNAGVVGEDNAQFGWLRRFPEFHDIACEDLTLTGENFVTADPFEPGKQVHTGAFVPFGTPTKPGQVIAGKVPCSGSVMRVRPNGGPLELVAWGFRNPFGLAFAPDGRLFVTDNSYDVRGSRAVFGAGDLLWEVRPGAWYGWPDFHGQQRIDDETYRAPGHPQPQRLLAIYPNEPPRPIAELAVHSSTNGLDFSRNASFGHVGHAFIAQFGDLAPVSGKVLAPVGFKVVRVDVTSGQVADFAVNRGPKQGPASRIGGGGLERPVAARFSPDGEALYVVDFGVLQSGKEGTQPREGTGVLWRIVRKPPLPSTNAGGK
jgi:glucose/arabinose dehydrogenase